MSLTALTHRRLGTAASSAATIAAWLDAIWAVVDPAITTYSDGSTRSFSGSTATGWTWTRVQVGGTTEALYATPPSGTMAQRVILAGRSVAPTPSPTMIGPDTFLASGLMISHQLSAGAFTTWNAALPFTNSRFMGYTRVTGATAATGFTSMSACVYETQETIIVELLTNGTGVQFALAGAIYDPESVASAVGETDGRRYGVVVCGGALVSNFLGGGATGAMWVHSTAAGNGHGYYRGSPWVSSDLMVKLMYRLPPEVRGLVRDPRTGVLAFPADYDQRMNRALQDLRTGRPPGP